MTRREVAKQVFTAHYLYEAFKFSVAVSTLIIWLPLALIFPEIADRMIIFLESIDLALEMK